MATVNELTSQAIRTLTEAYNTATKYLMSPIYNVSGYIKTGDIDDTDAIQRAVDDLPDGATVYLPKPLYTISRPIRISAANVKMIGSGHYWGTIVKTSVPLSSMLEVTNYGFHLEGIKLQGEGNSDTGGGLDSATRGILLFDPVNSANANLDEFTLERCTFTAMAVGVEIRSRNSNIRNNIFSHVKVGILLTGATNPTGLNRDHRIESNRFHSCGYKVVEAQRQNESVCISIPSSAAMQEVQILGNNFDDCDVCVSGSLQFAIISDNIANRAYGDFANLDTSTVNSSSLISVKICDNQINFYGVSNPSNGITLKGTGFKVEDNYISKPPRHGISAVSLILSTIQNNTIINPCNDGTGNYDAVNLDSGSFLNKVSDNFSIKTGSNKARYFISDNGNENTFGQNACQGYASGTEFYIPPDAAANKKAYGDTRSTLYAPRVHQGTAPPAEGRWAVGDIIYNTAPTSGAPVGWQCIGAGIPGTWQPFGYLTESKSGTFTTSGNGALVSFAIPHGLSTAPNFYSVQEASPDAGTASVRHVTADGTNLTVNFKTAPTTGVNNIMLRWKAEV